MSIPLLALLVAQSAAPTTPFTILDRIVPVTVPVVDAGVFDLDTGELRPPALVGPGGDVIYDNTCFQGAALPLRAGDIAIDEGRVPSPTSLSGGLCTAGCATSYTVDGFEIAYCTENVRPIAVIEFTNRGTCSSTAPLAHPIARFVLDSLPGAPEQGTFTCWTVTVDLGSARFVMAADGDGEYDHRVGDTFAWSIEFPSSLGLGNDGPLLAGYSGPPGGGGAISAPEPSGIRLRSPETPRAPA